MHIWSFYKKKLGYTDASTVDPPLRNSQILTHDHGEIVYTNKNKQFQEQNKLLWKRTGILEPTYVPFQQPFARAKPNGTNTSKHWSTAGLPWFKVCRTAISNFTYFNLPRKKRSGINRIANQVNDLFKVLNLKMVSAVHVYVI